MGNISKQGVGNATSYEYAYSEGTNQVSGGPGYDSNGNQLNSTGLTQILWNANGQPRSVTPLSGGAITGTYDALGRLVENGSSGYTQFVFSPSGQKIATVQGGTLVKGTVPLPGGATAIYSGTTGMPYIRHLDWLGSARLSTTWAHTVQSKVAYAPFGETYNEAGASANDRSFTGQEQDTVTGSAATGIYDFLFRKYDPAAGRWLSPDPSGWNAVGQSDPQSLDRYSYVGNRPMSLNDPLGLDCAYLSDNGTSIESLDQQSNASECISNGGYWANGAITNFVVMDNGVYDFTSLDANLNTLNTYYSGSANSNPTVDIDFTSYYYAMFVAQQQQQSQTMWSVSPDQRIYHIALAQPTVCGGGAFAYGGRSIDAGPISGFAGGIAEADTRSGGSAGGLVEVSGGVGIVGGEKLEKNWGQTGRFVGKNWGQTGRFVGAGGPGLRKPVSPQPRVPRVPGVGTRDSRMPIVLGWWARSR